MSRAHAYADARSWVQSNGGRVCPHLAYSNSSLVATEDIAAESLLLSIPLGCCVTQRDVLASTVGRQALRSAESAPASSTAAADVGLAFFLAADAFDETSFFAPYYSLLPLLGGTGEEDDPRALLPRSWPAAELASLLTGSAATLVAAEAARRSVVADYDAVTGSTCARRSGVLVVVVVMCTDNY